MALRVGLIKHCGFIWPLAYFKSGRPQGGMEGQFCWPIDVYWDLIIDLDLKSSRMNV